MRNDRTIPDPRSVDYRGVVWTQGPDGYLIPVDRITRKLVNLKNRGKRKVERSLRLQRTFGWCLFAIMLITYILQKFVF